ncbi:NDR1/HIN1-like protein 6, partial [Sorghum bicolor]|uniref:NDR1/HIN1-like protein 6 n=1 Tax=Sorghum bicolor TaxID=4558 RepID=UPI000B42562D
EGIVFAVLNLRGRGCCCRLLCCAVVTAVVLAVLAAAAVGALYLALDPKAPRYSVDRLSVSAFQVDPSTVTAQARFDVTVTAANPNSRIGIQYEPGSSLRVWYQSYRLERGALPAFYQGHRNTTVLPPALAGEVQLATAVVSGLQDAQRTGAVPLVFRADVPVRVEVGSFKGREKSSQS